MRYIILDTETTGLNPRTGDRLVEFAGLEMVGRKLTGRSLHLFVHPERDIPEEASRIHGITLDQLEGQPVFAGVAEQISDFIRGAGLIIHNAPFDMGFLDMEFTRIGLPSARSQAGEVIDTLAMAKEQFPGKRNNLDALCDRFEVDRSNRTFHGALIDCELLCEVYLAMTRGQESLLMDIEPIQSERGGPALALSGGARPRVQLASAEETALHESYLDGLDKAVKGSCLWRKPPPEAA